jgi:hypothetical protein
MAAGDVFQQGPTSIADAGFLDINPGASVEWVIHNVYVPEGTAVEFYYYDGTNSILFDSDSVDGSRYNQNWHVVNGTRVRVKNVSGASAFLAADGIVTK